MSAEISEIWKKFVPLREVVRKATKADVECDPKVLAKWQEMRNHIVAQYYCLVTKVAENISKKIKEVERDALASMGVDGLYGAIDGFEPSEGFKFETYAVFRIHGSIIDAIRREDWIPRLVRSRAKKLAHRHENLMSKLGRNPTEEEMSKEMDLSMEEYRHLIQTASIRQVQSLNSAFIGGDGDGLYQESITMMDCISDPTTPEPVEIMMQSEMMSKLFGSNFTSTEKKLIYAYFYEGRTMKDIALSVNLSESRVSQMMTGVIRRLKDKIERNPEYFGENYLKLLKK